MIIASHSEHAGPWKVATLVLAVAGVGAAWWGHTQTRRVDALELQAETSRSELIEARQALRQAEKRELPVSVSYSTAPSPSGLVAVVKSDFPRALEIVAMCSTPLSSQRKRFNLTIPAKGQIEIRDVDGWSLEPGNRIVLYNGAFRPAEYVVPDLLALRSQR